MAVASEYLSGYLEEVRTYLPVLKSHIAQLSETPARPDLLAEVYRLTHIIKGASSMVGIEGLSAIAGAMEVHLESLVEAEETLSPEAAAIMAATINRIETYCAGIGAGDTENEQLVVATQEAFARLTTAGDPPRQHLLEEDEVPAALPGDILSDNELLLEFRKEAQQHFQEMQRLLGEMRDAVTVQCPIDAQLREQVRQVRRQVHTVKGAAGMLGLDAVEALGRQVEEVLDWLYEKAADIDPGVMENLDEVTGQLALLVEERRSYETKRAESAIHCLHQWIQRGKVIEPPGLDLGAPSAPEKEKRQTSEAIQPVQEASSGDSTSGSLGSDLFSDEDRAILLEGFREEAEEHLQQLHKAMEILESEITTDGPLSDDHREEVRRVRRAVHTIKGASAVIGQENISGYAHRVEDFLDWLYEEAETAGPELINALLNALDIVGRLVEESQSVDLQQMQVILARLEEFSLRGTEPQGEVDVEEAYAQVESPGISLPEVELASRRQADTEKEKQESLQPTGPVEIAPTVRVAQTQIDTLVNLANELLVGISGFDRNMDRLHETIDELERATARIKDIALELETNFEVKALEDLRERFSRVEPTPTDMRGAEGCSDFDTMELDRYSRLNLIIRSLNESAIDVSAIRSTLDRVYSGLGGDINRQRRVVRELQLQTLHARMSPMSDVVPRLSRTVRDVALRLGKRVRLQINGEDVELDRMVWEKLADPLMHLIRNAIHHGIETTEERSASGKDPLAVLTLSGRREGNSIVIRFSDDGQGLDFKAIAAKARHLGLGEQLTEMDEQQLIECIFYPGFSTKTITEISGRGIGMDVVRENLKELQGSVSVETAKGKGTTFVMRVPLTMGVVRCLMVRITQVIYAIPINDVHEVRRVNGADIIEEKGIIYQNNKELPWYALESLLGHDPPGQEPHPLALLFEAGGRDVMLSIPGIIGQREVVVKELGSQLGTVPGISGAAVLGDGSVVPVLDVAGLISNNRMSGQTPQFRQQLEVPRPFTLMIVDDSISIRRVMSRLIRAQGWQPLEARDGLEALQLLEENEPDCILLDIEMPKMNGYEFLLKFGNLSRFREVPVVMLTSRTSAKHRERAFALGARGFLNKPCRDEDLVDIVVSLTGVSSAESLEQYGDG
ncbi:MAG: hypothetical protein CSA34_02500 [Desulfobulbus propionicus]|nr:MAG: hypothetical protein CSA34_02500 [Desulfobulbus propionicus]